jgi:hypothetical protein
MAAFNKNLIIFLLSFIITPYYYFILENMQPIHSYLLEHFKYLKGMYINDK